MKAQDYRAQAEDSYNQALSRLQNLSAQRAQYNSMLMGKQMDEYNRQQGQMQQERDDQGQGWLGSALSGAGVGMMTGSPIGAVIGGLAGAGLGIAKGAAYRERNKHEGLGDALWGTLSNVGAQVNSVNPAQVAGLIGGYQKGQEANAARMAAANQGVGGSSGMNFGSDVENKFLQGEAGAGNWNTASNPEMMRISPAVQAPAPPPMHATTDDLRELQRQGNMYGAQSSWGRVG